MANNIENSPNKNLPWIGRFAPSPTGELHLGSLVAAVASYLIAKTQKGQWLVRIEDIDPPREVPGASKSILNSLESFGLHWDGEVVYQSERNSIYQQYFEELIQKRFVYQCDCSRTTIANRSGGIYDGFCKERNLRENDQFAYRTIFSNGFESFKDQILGDCRFDTQLDKQDFIVRRRDGIFAYQLAVVVDDIEQGVNHVVRGRDILDSTPRQNFLYSCFKHRQPVYFHLPLVKDELGNKISKSEGALGLDKQRASEQLLLALKHLGQSIDIQMEDATPEEIICHFEKNWNMDKIVETNL